MKFQLHHASCALPWADRVFPCYCLRHDSMRPRRRYRTAPRISFEYKQDGSHVSSLNFPTSISGYLSLSTATSRFLFQISHICQYYILLYHKGLYCVSSAHPTDTMQARKALFVLGAATLVAGQNATAPANLASLIDSLPECGVNCLSDASAAVGCDVTDYACQCNSYTEIEASSGTCLQTNCSATDVASMSQSKPHLHTSIYEYERSLTSYIGTISVTAQICDLIDDTTAGAPSMAPGNTTSPIYTNSSTTVLVVDKYTTWCPKATEFTVNGKGYTATGPTMLTVTDCPCTITTVRNPIPLFFNN